MVLEGDVYVFHCLCYQEIYIAVVEKATHTYIYEKNCILNISHLYILSK